MDWRIAYVVSAMVNLSRDPRKTAARPVKDFLMRFGSDAQERPRQTWQEQKQLALLYSGFTSD